MAWSPHELREGNQGCREEDAARFVTAIAAVKDAPTVVTKVKEAIILFRDLRAQKKAAKKNAVETLDAAAEE